MNRPNKDDYHKGWERLSSSGCKELLKSPAHFMLRYGPSARRPAPTAAMKLGTAVHMLVLEGEEVFREHVACRPEGLSLRSKAGKAEMAAFLEANPKVKEEMVFSMADYDSMFWMRDAVFDHPLAAELLSEGQPEYYYEWHDGGSAAPCKALADWYSPHHIVDLKTCMDASPEGFAKAVYNFKYHVSSSFYGIGDAELNHGQTKQWYWIAVEKHTNQVAVYTPDETMEQLGARDARHGMSLFAQCRALNKWESYSDKAVELMSPRWAR